MAAGQQRLGSLLVELGFIDQEQLDSALDEQNLTGRRLGKILVDAAVITEDRLVHALSRQLGIETCDPLTAIIHERVLKLLPADLAYRHRVIPVALKKEDTGETIFVATSDPLNKVALSDIRASTNNRRVRWLLAGETAMEMALARHYGSPPKRSLKPTPLPEGTQVITGKPVSAPKSSGSNRPLPSAPPGPRTSDLFMLNELNGGSSMSSSPLVLEGFGFGENLPPIDVPPELLASPDAALRIIEAEMPRPSNGSDLPIEIVDEDDGPLALPSADLVAVEPEPVEEPIQAAPENGHRLPAMPPPGQSLPSWGDLVGGDLMVPSLFPWQPDPLPSGSVPRPPDTFEIGDDSVEEERTVPDDTDDMGDRARPDRSEDLLAELAARVREVAEATDSPTEPGLIVDQSKFEISDTGELPDASLDAIPTETSSPFEEDATEMEVSRSLVMREVLLRFIDNGTLEVGSQVILRLLVSIMEQEGLLTEERIAAAMKDKK